MELVKGIKITDYCDEHNLSTKERLELFIQVCHAVRHAHQKGIIHRDLKPSNILVASDDGVPVPKVIDFGIAKATQGRLTDQTLFTAFEQFIGTPAYMSPEQAELTMEDVDTRTDIYSLGVLLYELLTGKTPFDAQELLASGLDAMRRTIREQEPVRPSTKLSTMLEVELTTTAKHRNTEAVKLIHLLRGDLDWIVMKCLEKDRGRRYETANGLANDVRRHLNCEPVVARPTSKLYEFQKTVRRHKFGFAAAAALITVLALGVVVSALEAIRAQTEAAKATAISDFLQEMLRSANPEALKGSDYTVRQLLDDFSAGLGNQLQNQPQVEATIRATIGKAYYRLGDGAKAQQQSERALALRRRVFGEQHEQVAEIAVDLAWSFYEQDQWPAAEQFSRQALAIYRKAGTTGQRVINALWVRQKALAAMGRDDEAEAVTTEALAIAQGAHQFPEVASMLHGLAELKNKQSKYAEAEILALRAIEMHRQLHGSNHLETAWALLGLGTAQRELHKFADAETSLREALQIFRKQYSYGHKSVDLAVDNLRSVLQAKGDAAGIAALAQDQLVEANRRIVRNDAAAQACMQLCLTDADRGDWLAATQHYKAALALCQDQSAASRKVLAKACIQFAERARNGRPEMAEQVDRQAVIWFRQLAQEDPKDTSVGDELANSLHELTSVLYDEDKCADAEPVCREAISLFKQMTQDAPVRNDLAESQAHSQWQLANILVQLGRPEEAETVSRETLQTFEEGTRRFPNLPYFRQEPRFSQQLHGDVLSRLGHVDEAVASHREAIAIFEQVAKENPKRSDYAIDLGHSHWRLAEVFTTARRGAEAETALRESLHLFERATRDFPGDRRVRQELGLSKRRLADLLSGRGQIEEAEQLFRGALTLYAALAVEPPQDAVYRTDHASTTWSLVYLLALQGKLPEAEKVCRAEVEACGQTNAEFAENTGVRNVEAEGHRYLGFVLGRLGRIDEAEREYRASIALYPWLKAAAPAHVFYTQQEAYATWMLGELLEGAGRLDAAETEYRHAIALHEKATVDFPTEPVLRDHLDSVRSRLVELLRRSGRLADAKAIACQAAQKLQTATAQYENLASDGNRRRECWILAISCEAVGELLKGLGLTREAEKAYRDAQALWRKLVAAANAADYRFHLAVNHDALGGLLRDAKRFDEASEAFQQALEVWRKLVADFNNDDYRNYLAGTLDNLAETLRIQGKVAEAESLDREAAERGDALMKNNIAWRLATDLDPKNRDGPNAVIYAEKAVTATSRTNAVFLDTLAAAYAEVGRFTDGVRVQQEAIALLSDQNEKLDYRSRLKLYESNQPYRDHGLLAKRALALLNAGQFDKAEPVARECLTRREIEIPDDWRTFNAKSLLGGALLGQNKFSEAEPLLLAGYEGLKQREDKLPKDSPRIKEALQRLVQLYEAASRPDQAAEWKQKLAEFDQPTKH
jgi:tetratricopeptide (TPR) repeat protein